MRLKNFLLTAGLAAASLLAAIPRAKATTCPNATAITSLPVTNQTLVCGTANDQSATTIVQNCNGSTSYYGGLEALYTFTPTTTGIVRVEYTGQTWAGIFVFSGCPSTTGTTVVACTTSSTASKFVDVSVVSGTTYYLMFDTWPSPASPCSGTFSILLPCNGIPIAGTASGTVTNTCPGGTSVLSLAGNSAGPGVVYQWQSSITSTTAGFTNITTGATNNTYTTPGLTTTTYYRAIVKCATTNDSVFSNAVTVTVTPPPTTTATIPYSQSFENWISTCSVTDRPGTEWTTSPFNGDAAWRRDDQGASAAWNSAAFGIYSPTFTAGANSARFHSYYTSGQGSMLLNVNLSPAGSKLISFDYNNTSGSDSLYVELSTDGGTTWTILASLGLSTGWAAQNVPTNSTAAAAIIRFRAKGDFGFSTDIGMDNLNIAVVTCGLPSAVTASAVTATGATVSWTAPPTTPALGYRYELRTSGAAGSGAVGLAQPAATIPNTQTSVALSGLSGTTTYTLYVRSICAVGDSSAWVSAGFITLIDCAGAPVITACGVSQSFTIPLGNGVWGPYIQTPTGNAPYQTLGLERIYTFTAPTTGVYTLDVTATNSQWADYFYKPVATGACVNSGWTYIDDMYSPFTDTFTMIGGTQYYILVDAESATTGPAQTFRIICPPTCGVPTTLTATTTTTTAALGWTQASPGSPTSWQISYGTGITSPAAGTLVIANANPYPLSGLTAATNYTFYVRAICGPGDTSAWSGALSFATQCVSAALPFSENFNTFLPACWSQATGFLTTAPSALTPATFGNWTADGYLNNGTSGATKINLYSTFHRDWLITPTIDLGATPGNFQLEFDMAVTVWNATTSSAVLYDSLGTDDTLAVVVSYNNGQTWSSANALRVFTYADDTLPSQRYYLPFSGSGEIKIGFYASDGTISNCSSCPAPADIDVFIDSVLVISTCSAPNVALGNDTTVCGNVTSLVFDAGQAPAGATYTWSNTFNSTTATTQTFNAASVINAMDATPPLANVVSFYSTVTVSAGCSKTDTINVGVTYTPRVTSITATQSGNTSWDFSPVGDLYATSYTYNFGDGTTASTLNASHTYAANGTYTVLLIVSNACGVDTVSTTVTVTTGIEGVLADGSSVSIFPNPTAADATLEVTGGAALRSYQVMSATGALVQQHTVKGKGVTRAALNTHALAPGIYTLRIQLDKGVVVRKLEVLK